MSSERHGSRSGSHGRHHRSRRFRWLRRNRRWILPALILLLCAAAALGFWIRKIRMEQLPYEHIRWITSDTDIDSLSLTSDTKKVSDLKGNKLLLFTHPWSIQTALDRNEGLTLEEFSR